MAILRQEAESVAAAASDEPPGYNSVSVPDPLHTFCDGPLWENLHRSHYRMALRYASYWLSLPEARLHWFSKAFPCVLVLFFCFSQVFDFAKATDWTVFHCISEMIFGNSKTWIAIVKAFRITFSIFYLFSIFLAMTIRHRMADRLENYLNGSLLMDRVLWHGLRRLDIILFPFDFILRLFSLVFLPLIADWLIPLRLFLHGLEAPGALFYFCDILHATILFFYFPSLLKSYWKERNWGGEWWMKNGFGYMLDPHWNYYLSCRDSFVVAKTQGDWSQADRLLFQHLIPTTQLLIANYKHISAQTGITLLYRMHFQDRKPFKSE